MINGIILIVAGILLFNLIIFVHEFGHFFTAKMSGMLVHEFALGMGPKFFSFTKGETVYSLRLFPIGGFCDIEGENGDTGNDRSFASKPIWKRMIVIITGAIMNIILGIIFMSVLLVQQDLLPYPMIADFAENSKFEQAGLSVGDTITEVDGYAIYSEKDLSFALAIADPNSVDLEVERAGEKLEFTDITLDSEEMSGRTVTVMDFYIYGEPISFTGVIEKTFVDSLSIIRMVLASLEGLVTGEFGFNEVSGPIGATQAIAEAASVGLQESLIAGFNNILFMMAVISINLGVFNLLPIPALDGGRFVFLLIELIFRKPVPEKVETYVNTAGFVVLIGFMVVVAFKDVYYLFV